MRYSLRTLVLLTAVAPPGIAFVWFAWWPLLILVLCLAALVLWVAGGLAFCRLVAERLVGSLMG